MKNVEKVTKERDEVIQNLLKRYEKCLELLPEDCKKGVRNHTHMKKIIEERK